VQIDVYMLDIFCNLRVGMWDRGKIVGAHMVVPVALTLSGTFGHGVSAGRVAPHPASSSASKTSTADSGANGVVDKMSEVSV
jgi:hypothetical protein